MPWKFPPVWREYFGQVVQVRCCGDAPRVAKSNQRQGLNAPETRGGILPNRDAGSKRKLCEYHAQAPQTIHRISTANNSRTFRL
jgi:hypothetical protein